MSEKTRYVEVFGDERQELLATQDDLGTPQLFGGGEGGYYALADELRAWREARSANTSCEKP